LDSLNIPYSNLVYTEKAQVEELFANLGTWTYGLDYEVKEFTNFPLITWQEFYDDYTNCNNYATNIDELKTKLVPNASLIE
jgi:vacuolar-type H+-ATPase catalytic subunit A/Vma1